MGNKRSSINVSEAASTYIVLSRTQTLISNLEKQMNAAMRRISDMTESLDPQTRAQLEEYVKNVTGIITLLSTRSAAIKTNVDTLLGKAINIDEKSKRSLSNLNETAKGTKSKLTKR